MTLYAYLRVSTDTQDVNNQELGMPELVPDTVSGRVA